MELEWPRWTGFAGVVPGDHGQFHAATGTLTNRGPHRLHRRVQPVATDWPIVANDEQGRYRCDRARSRRKPTSRVHCVEFVSPPLHRTPRVRRCASTDELRAVSPSDHDRRHLACDVVAWASIDVSHVVPRHLIIASKVANDQPRGTRTHSHPSRARDHQRDEAKRRQHRRGGRVRCRWAPRQGSAEGTAMNTPMRMFDLPRTGTSYRTHADCRTACTPLGQRAANNATHAERQVWRAVSPGGVRRSSVWRRGTSPSLRSGASSGPSSL